MKQIILITDGCSNVGVSPVVAAAHALAEGIVVNVIGVVDSGEIGELGAAEIAEIAEAGGGMSRIVSPERLSQTVQMMTRKTVAHTIKQVVNKELHSMMGDMSVEELPPNQRAHVVQVIDELGETASLQVALLIDCSASMKPKLRSVEEAIHDLMLSLQARAGVSELAVMHFPGRKSGEDWELDAEWTTNLAKSGHLFYKLNMKGTTPTGPALMQTIGYIARHGAEPADQASQGPLAQYKEGMLSDYVV